MMFKFLLAILLALIQLGSAYPSFALPQLETRADPNPWQPVPAGGGKPWQDYHLMHYLRADLRR